jgi:hypothetical protein
MRFAIAILAKEMAAAALAQDSPFSSQEEQQLRAVWPQIREAAQFEHVDWQALGLARAPGDAQARRLMSEHWSELRQARDFDAIDWDEVTGYQSSRFGRSSGSERRDDVAFNASPFSRQEAEQLRQVWPSVRGAAEFDDINWQQVGLPRAPGDSEARAIMAQNWDELRREADFDDIDWDRYSAYSRSSGFDRSASAYESSPFTREEERVMGQVWPQIREAARFEDIDWRQFGLNRAPGDRDARELMSDHWSELRQEQRFDDIDWEDYERSRVSLR